MASRTLRNAAKNLKRSREADFKVTNDVNDAIFSNLSRLAGRSGRVLSKYNQKRLAKSTAAQQRLADKGRRSVRHFLKGSTSDPFASGAVASAANDIKNVAQAGNFAAKGQVRAGKMIARSANELVALQQSGAAELSANAQSAAAQALTERAAVDATTLAQLAHDELMQRRDQQFQREMAKKEYQRQTKLMGLEEEKAKKELGATFGQLKPVVTAFSTMVPEVLTMIQENPDITREEIVTALTEKGLISLEDSTSPVVMRLIYNLMTNNSPGQADSVIDEFIESMSLDPRWAMMDRKGRSKLKDYIGAALAATQAKLAAQGFASGDSGSGGGGVVDATADTYSGVYGYYGRNRNE